MFSVWKLRFRSEQVFEGGVQMLHGLGDGEGIHFLAGVFAGFDGGFEVVASDLDGERVGDDFAGASLVFLPGAVRECDGDRLAIGEEFDIDGVGVAGGDGYDQPLIEAVDVGFGPAVLGVEVVEHGEKYSGWGERGQTGAANWSG